MKLQKLSQAILIATVSLLIVASSAAAAPGGGPVQETAVFFAEAVNLPGWLGGVLAVLSIILPVAAFQWMRQK